METNSTVPDIWRALSACRETATGLRSISVAQYGERELRAGIFFPEGAEALLTGFRERIPRSLPQGRGFRVEVLAGDVPDASRNWIAILRSPGADAEMFAVMAEDLRQVLEKRSLDISVFLDRVRAWQAFMESGRPLEMSERAEAGLFGELVILDRLMDMIGERRALQGWTGPRGMLHDFRFDDCTETLDLVRRLPENFGRYERSHVQALPACFVLGRLGSGRRCLCGCIVLSPSRLNTAHKRERQTRR